MKKIYTTALAIFAILSVYAQEDIKKEDVKWIDTTSFRLGNYKLLLISNKDSLAEIRVGAVKNPKPDGYWSGIDIGVNLFTDIHGDANLPKDDRMWENEPIRSLNWNLNFGQFVQPITRNKYSLAMITGIGVSYRSFSFQRKNLDIVTNDDETSLVVNPDEEYSKRKLRIAYLSAPLMLGFNTSADHDNNFHISAGIIGSLRLSSLYKQKFEVTGGNEKKVKTRDDFNLNPFRVDATIRAGYKDFTAFVQYGITPLFKDGEGPELLPLTFGVQILPF